jgi:Flp pilus assembly protein TadD
MLVTLAPVLNARWMPLDAFAERYLYLPSVGICWLLGWGLLRLRARASARGANWSRALAGACGILVALCLLRIVTRNRDWRNSFTLFSNTLASCPDAYYIRRYLGASYWLIGDIDSAEQEWRKTLEVAPHDSLTISNLGLVCLKKRRYSEATELFKKALGFDPSNEDAHLYLGLIYMERHWLELAEPELRAAVSLSPQNLEARNRLGMLYLNTGRLEEAEEQFRLSIKTQPNDSGYSNLGEIYLRRGDPGSAERAFQSATSLNPNNSQAHFKLGALYLSEGRKAEALREYQEGLKGNPENRDALAVLQKLSAQAGEK